VRSFDFIVDLLNRMDSSEPYALDPSGDKALGIAKRVRRTALRDGGPDHVLQHADSHFGMPDSALAYARSLAEPLYLPGKRSASS